MRARCATGQLLRAVVHLLQRKKADRCEASWDAFMGFLSHSPKGAAHQRPLTSPRALLMPGDLDERVEEVQAQRREARAPAQQRCQRVHQRDIARPARGLRRGVLKARA